MRFVAVGLLLCWTPFALAQSTQTLTFAESPGPTPNPERGFYDTCDPLAGTAPGPINLAACGNAGPSGATVLYRYFDLEAFRDGPISQAYLDRMASDFAVIRQAGFKIVPRFAYQIDPDDLTPPHNDATKARVLGHIDQVGPVLAANADVIVALQAGFIGLWGEWYYTDHFVQDPAQPWVITPADFQDRREVLGRLLAVLPPSRSVQIRVPYHKMEMFGETSPLPDGDAHTGSARARVGHHNDCFLADPFDVGTFRESHLAADRAYLAAETRNLPMGGETCDPAGGEGSPRFACAAALADMAAFHWTYLNRDYYDGPTVEVMDTTKAYRGADDVWMDGECFDDVEARLGYRLVLEAATVPVTVRPGGAFPFALDFRNDGFAALINERPVQLVLQRQGTTERLVADLPADPRRWYPGPHELAYTLGIRPDAPPGVYDLFLALPDAAPGLAGRADYAVRTSNEGTWNASLGMNRLATITVSESAEGPAYTGTLWFGGAPVAAEPGPSGGVEVSVTPNPFSGTATVRVESRLAGPLRIEVLDGLGRLVQVLFDGAVPAGGVYTAPLEGSALSPGLYAIRVAGPDGVSATRLVTKAALPLRR